MKPIRRLIRKVTALTLAMLVSAGAFPLDVFGYGNYQSPIALVNEGFIITDRSGTAVGSDYTFELRWRQPNVSLVPDTASVDATPNNPTEGYEIYMRNGTAKTPESMLEDVEVETPSNPPNPTFMSRSLTPPNLLGGQLYVFRINPYHNNLYPARNPDGTPAAPVPGRAPLLPGSQNAEVLYLTDINVTAEGSGKTLTVTWDNPLLDDKNVFSGYRIYYSKRDAVSTTMPNEPYIDVSITSPDLVSINEDGAYQLQYTFTDANLQSGIFYSVKVEPLYRNALVRNGLKTIMVGETTYGIAYTQMSREYIYKEAYIEPELMVTALDGERIILSWDDMSSNSPRVRKIIIYQGTGVWPEINFNTPGIIGTMEGASAQSKHDWITKWPDGIGYYQLKIEFEDNSVQYTKIAIFDPVTIDFTPYKPDISSITDNGELPLTMDISFRAFVRAVYDAETEIADDDLGKYIDPDITYDIYVTDDLENFNNVLYQNHPVVSGLSATELTQNRYTVSENGQDVWVLDYITPVSGYVPVIDGVIQDPQPLQDNKIYYVKVIARRTTPEQQKAESDVASHYIAPIDEVPTKPLMISRPPLHVKEETETAITIGWDTTWFEFFYNGDWHTILGKDDTGGWVFGRQAETTINPLRLNASNFQPLYLDDISINAKKAEVIAALASYGMAVEPDEVRFMNLEGAEYEVHVVPFDYIDGLGGYEEYMNRVLIPDNLWRGPVEPTGGTARRPELTISEIDAPETADLLPDTSYVIYFRPYTAEAAHFPSYVVGTTKAITKPIEVTPTVPTLTLASPTDTSLTAMWDYSPDLTYELYYSEKLTDYPDDGTVIPWEDIQETGTVSDGTMTYVITGLFPETLYHVWIRAIAQNTAGPTPSAPSNPASATTLDIAAPLPPSGLGPISKEHLNLYNRANSTNYIPVNYDYIIMEWMRDSLDDGDQEDAAQTEETEGSAEFLPNPDVASMLAVKFNELITNRNYYIRAKTTLTITKGDDGIERSYSYTIQISPTSDFMDFVEITVPAMEALETLDPVYSKRKESGWCTTVVIKTSPSDTEYDGDKNPDMYPLPSQDYEVKYDYVTDTLTFRFRTDGTDASGAKDNSVDQRFISNLIASKIYNYNIDLSKYNNQTVTNRVVELPFSIYSAFNERKINLTITADNATVNLYPGSLETAEIKALSDFGKNSRVRITWNQNAVGTPALDQQSQYASKPQKLSIQVITPTRTVNMNNLAKSVKVDMKLENRYLMVDKNVGAYIADVNTVGWERMNSQYDGVSGMMSFMTYKPANYAAIVKSAPAVSETDYSYEAMLNVTARLNITDLGVYNPKAPVSAQQLNNMTVAIVKNSKSVAINQPLSPADATALSKSRMLVSSNSHVVSREAGVAALVSLYERKTNTVIKSYSSLYETPYKDIGSATEAYRNSLLKAGDLGFYYNPSASPKVNLTMGDMFYMIDIIMQDGGIY